MCVVCGLGGKRIIFKRALRAASVKALQSAELKQQSTTPAEFAAFVKAEQAKWGPAVQATGVKLE